eukprot:CCRYP_007088-RA/>CCRYP_007088-RA protein AED:0.41 eAED:0.44 QI:0/0/0/1/0/0/2/0/284
MLEYQHLIKCSKYCKMWSKAFGKEIGRLTQGLEGIVEGTNMISFIAIQDVPPEQQTDIKYARICASHRPEKQDPNQISITLGEKISYTTLATSAHELPTCSQKNFSSTPGAKFMSLDITTDPNTYKCTSQTSLKTKIATANGYVITECWKAIYGLPQAGILANKFLEKCLNKYGYYQHNYTNGLWTHKTKPIQFALVVDNFAVKYTRDKDVQHLSHSLTAINPDTKKNMFEVSTNMQGNLFIGITMDWDYTITDCIYRIPAEGILYLWSILVTFCKMVTKKWPI